MAATTFEVERAGSAGVIRVGGDVTAASETGLMDAYQRVSEGGVRAILLDFSDLAYMNSGGIGLLVTLLVRVQRAGQRLLATGLSEHYRQILSLTRLDEAIDIHPDRATAMAAASA